MALFLFKRFMKIFELLYSPNTAWLVSSIAMAVVLWQHHWLRTNLPNFDKNLVVVFPVHTKDADTLLHNIAEEWGSPCSGHNRRQVNGLLLFTTNANRDPAFRRTSSAIIKHLRKTGCFNSVNSLIVEVAPEHDWHPFAPSAMFFAAVTSARVLESGAFMFWMEPDVLPCPGRRHWLDAVYRQATLETGRAWMHGSIVRNHTAPEAPFTPYNEHINGNAIYNLRDERFMEFLHEVYDEMVIDSARFAHSFDIAIYYVSRHLHGFWSWAAVRHRFRYADWIQNRYNARTNITELCERHPELQLVHGSNIVY